MGLIHMNGRVYDPLLGRFGTPDPMTKSPFSTQGWNRYSYVGNSPVNFTDPSGYCFMGCFWKPVFRAVGNLFRQVPILGTVLQIAAGAICGRPCAALASAFVAGVTSGDLGLAIKAGIISILTSMAVDGVMQGLSAGTSTPGAGTGSSNWGHPSGLGMGGLQTGGTGSGSLVELAQVQVPGIYVEATDAAKAAAKAAAPGNCAGCVDWVPSKDGFNAFMSSIPVIGVGFAFRDFQDSWKASHYWSAAAASLGMIPGAGAFKGLAGQGGRFGSLRARGAVGDQLTPHHMPQDALGFTSRADGGALVMTNAEHELTRTYGEVCTLHR